MRRIWLISIAFVSLFLGVQFAHADLRVVTGPQGGTNIGTTTDSNIGKALIVSSTNPLVWTLGEAGRGGSTSSPFTPCAYWSTTTPFSWDSVCIEDQINTSTVNPYINLAVDPNFSDAPGNYPQYWVTTTFNFDAGPGGGDGTGLISKDTSNCNGQSSCAKVDFLAPSDGSGQGFSIDQTFTYDSAKTYIGKIDFQRLHNNVGTNNLTCIAWTNFYFADIFSSPPSGSKYWSFISSSWYADFNTFLPDALACSSDPATTWQRLSVSGPTGSMGTTTGHFIILMGMADPAASTDTVYINLANYGAVTSTDSITTGTNQWVFTSPSTSYPINFKGALLTADHGVSTTAITLTTGATDTYVLQSNSSGLGSWVAPTSLGITSSPWIVTAGNNIRYPRSVCIGVDSGVNCDLYSQGTLAADYVNSRGHLSVGAIDPNTQNQAFTCYGTNGDCSMLANSNSTPTAFSGSDIGSFGAGSRYFWYAKKMAVRAGYVNNDQWDDSFVGALSLATGWNTIASATSSIALGYGGSATGFGAVALGNCNASGTSSLCSGNNVGANATYSFAFGSDSFVHSGADASLAFGFSSNAIGVGSAVLGGLGGTTNGTYSIILGGNGNNANGYASIAGGNTSVASGTTAFSFGNGAQATADNTIALGFSVLASGIDSSVFGTNINVTGNYSRGFSLGSNGIFNPVVSQSYVTAFVGDPTNGGRVVIGTTTASNATLTVTNNTYTYSNALEVDGTTLLATTTVSSTLFVQNSAGNAQVDITNTAAGGRHWSIEVGGGNLLDNGDMLVRNETDGTNGPLFSRTGKVGIGTTTPSALLTITGGDVYITDYTKGVIQVSPDGTCWRQSLSNIGIATWNSITCP